MRKRLFFWITVLLVLSLTACGKESEITTEQVDLLYTEFVHVDLTELRREYHANEARTREKYTNAYVRVLVTVTSVKDRTHFSVRQQDASYTKVYATCTLKNSYYEDTVLEMNAGDIVILRGRITEFANARMTLNMDIYQIDVLSE